jgi:hypothetical protein
MRSSPVASKHSKLINGTFCDPCQQLSDCARGASRCSHRLKIENPVLNGASGPREGQGPVQGHAYPKSMRRLDLDF